MKAGDGVKLGFRQLLTLSISAMILVLAGVMLVVALITSRQRIVAGVSTQLQLAAEFKAAQVNGWLEDAAEITRLVAVDQDMQDSILALTQVSALDDEQGQRNRTYLLARLADLKHTFPNIQSVSLLHPVSGRVLLSNVPALEGRVRLNEKYFIEGQKGDYTSPVEYSVGSEAPVVYVSAPVNGENELAAVVVVELKISNLEALMNARSGLPESGRAYLVDAFGFYVTTPPGLEDGSLHKTAESFAVSQVLREQSGSGLYLDPHGAPVLGVYTWLPETRMGLLVEIDQAKLTAQIRQAWTVIVLAILAMLTVLLVTGSWLAGWLVKPLEQISQTAVQLRLGDMRARAPVAGPQEVERLALAFNEMADTVENSQARLESLVSERTHSLEIEVEERSRAEEELQRQYAALQQAQARLLQSEKLAAIGRLVAGVAHELNNPLTSVILYSQIAQQRSDDERLQRDMERVVSEAKRAAAIVRGLLDFARQRPVEAAPVQINTLLQECLKIVAHELRLHSIAPHLALAPDLPVTVTDGQQIRQVFLNLINNAWQAIAAARESGNLWIASAAGPAAYPQPGKPAQPVVRVIIDDDGPGIPEGLRARIFDPFFSTKPVGAGTGLGLAICHGIVTENGGQIWVENRPGGGARFLVELPLVAPPGQATAGEAGPQLAAPAQPGAWALIVDDEPHLLAAAAQAIRSLGCQVDMEGDARSALERLRQRRYDLVVSDIRMPGMSGPEFFRQAQVIDPGIERRLLFITGDSVSLETRKFLEESGQPYLAKPFDLRQLTEKVTQVLKPAGS